MATEKQVSAAVQDLMRDTARLFGQAYKANMQLLQIDTFAANDDAAQVLLSDLEQARTQYKLSLDRTRTLAKALEKEEVSQQTTTAAAETGSDQPTDRLDKLQKEHGMLRKQALEKSEQVRKLLDCVRQIQLTSAQLLQI